MEAVGAALSAPKRFWRVLTAKTPEKAPEPQPKEPPASSWMREELDRIERTKAAKKAELDRKTAEVAIEADRMERLKPMLEELHQTLQRSKDDPELNEILRDTGISSWTGPRSDLVERSMWKNARAKIELLDQSRKNAGNASRSISQPEPARQQTPRQKSGRSGPGF